MVDIKYYHVDDPEFRTKRFEFLKSLDLDIKDSEMKYQLIGFYYNKWKHFNEFTQSQWEYCDSMLRFPMNNEIIIDIDKKIYLDKSDKLDKEASIKASLDIAFNIMNRLDKENIKYSLYFSGNKGWHIKCLIGGFDIKNSELINATRLKSENSQLFIKLIKIGFIKYFNLDIGIDSDMAIDPCLFNKKQLVRTEGSLHDKSGLWKTYISPPYSNKEKILSEIKKFGNRSSINFNYLNEKNILSANMSRFIFNYVKEEIEDKLKEQNVIAKYQKKANETFNEKNLYGYIEAFKELYVEGQRFNVSPAIISFFYLITNQDKKRAWQLYHDNFIDLMDNDTQFRAIFERVWSLNLNKEKVSVYGILEFNNIISRDEFKEKVKFINRNNPLKIGSKNLDNRKNE